MKLSTYLKHHQISQKEFGKAVGVHSASVSHWITERMAVSVKNCIVIETVTHGEVSRKDLRPYDWRTIWPELVDAQ